MKPNRIATPSRASAPANRSGLDRSARHGYVLFLVLIVLVVAGTSLASLASTSHALVLDSVARQETLQQRWALLSCERTLLPRAQRVFDLREELQPRADPQTTLIDQVTLGGQRISLVISDEDAKLNLNTLYHRGDIRKTQAAVRKVVGTAALTTIKLLPETAPQAPQESSSSLGSSESDDESEEDDAKEVLAPPAFQSWGEIFAFEALGHSGLYALPQLTQSVTCWGRGSLNVARASDDVILEVCKSIVTDGLARRFLKALRDAEVPNLKILLQKEVGNEEDREKLDSVLTETSTTFSLWQIAEGKQRKQLSFSVLHADEEGIFQTTRFEF